MRRRTWDAKTKAMIVLEGLKGKPVAEVCTEHQISQSPVLSVARPVSGPCAQSL